jgi:hypothetical protein
MNWVEQTISRFGESIGIPTLALEEGRSLRLKLANDCSILIHNLPDLPIAEVVVCRSEPITYSSSALFRAALQAADFRSPSAWPVQAAANNKELILAMRIPQRAFAFNVLEQALNQLGELHLKVRQLG